MKFTVTFYIDHDTLEDDFDDIVEASGMNGNELWDWVHENVPDAFTYQFDTETRTATPLEPGNEGVDDWHETLVQKNLAIKERMRQDYAEELERQLQEAVHALSQEADRSTPYAQALMKFIFETRNDLKFWQQEKV